MSATQLAVELLQWFGFLLVAAAVELVIAATYTRRKVRADVKADVTQLLHGELFPKLEGLGQMRGGVDPTQLANRRWQLEEDRARVKALILAELTRRMGNPLTAAASFKLIPRDLMDAAARAGERWMDVLEPILDLATKEEGQPTSWNT